MLEDLAGQGLEMALASAQPPPPIKAAEIIELAKHGLKQGGVVGIWGKAPKDVHVVTVVRGGDRPEVRKVLDLALAADRRGADEAAPVQKAGRTIHTASKDMSWWIEKGDLVFSDSPDTVLDVLDGKSPNAVDHPLRAALARGGDGFLPVALGFVDITKLPPMPPEAVRLGLDGVKRIEFLWGFQDDALRSVLRAVAPSPRRGLLALVDQPTFTIDALPPLPPELTGFTVFSIDLAKTYDKVLEIVKTTRPEMADQIPAIEGAIEQQLGVNLRNDILARLGPKLSFYMENPTGDRRRTRCSRCSPCSPGVTFSFEVRDEPALAKSLETLIARVNDMLKQQQAARGGDAPAMEFVKLREPRGGLRAEPAAGLLPPGPFASLQPTLMLGTDRLAIAATTAAARKAMEPKRPDKTWKPTGSFVPVARRLPPGMIILNISDPRDTIPAGIAMLPSLVPQLNAMIGQSQRRAGRQGEVPMIRLDRGPGPHGRRDIQAALPGLDGPDRRRPGDQPRRPRVDPRPQLAGDQRRPHRAACCPRCRRPARPRGARSAPTTSSRSPWRCTTTTPRQRRLPQAGDHRQGRQAAVELAGGHPALPRAAGALQQVQARRAVGQPAQQGPDQGDAHDLRMPQPAHRPSRA